MSLEIREAGRKRMPSMLLRNIEPFQLEHKAGQLDSHRICLQLLISASTASTVLPFEGIWSAEFYASWACGTRNGGRVERVSTYYAPLKGFGRTGTSLSLVFKVSPLDHYAFEHLPTLQTSFFAICCRALGGDYTYIYNHIYIYI